jgi:hypothetical protein
MQRMLKRLAPPLAWPTPRPALSSPKISKTLSGRVTSKALRGRVRVPLPQARRPLERPRLQSAAGGGEDDESRVKGPRVTARNLIKSAVMVNVPPG